MKEIKTMNLRESKKTGRIGRKKEKVENDIIIF